MVATDSSACYHHKITLVKLVATSTGNPFMSSSLNRVLAFGYAFFIMLVTVCASSAADVRTRKHVEDMTSAEWKTLGTAIQALHALDKFDGTGKSIFPQGADSYERFVQIHGDARESGACLHGSEEVWFWHRAFLLHFENRLRATSPPASSNITLPYWDWAERSSGSKGFPQAYETATSPLFHDRLDHTSTAKNFSPLAAARDSATDDAAAFVETLLKTGDWGKFGGTVNGPEGIEGDLESFTHDVIHGSYIGKDNHSPKLAVRDPIFWAHHSNLDRLVDQWQTRHPAAKKCLECDALAYDRDIDLGPLKVSDVISNNSIKGVQVIYRARSVAMAQNETMSAAAAVDDQTSTGPSSSYKFVLPAKSQDARLIIPDVQVKSDTSYRGEIYLFPEDVEFSPNRDFKNRYRIGVFGSFSASQALEGAKAGHFNVAVRKGVDLTESLNRLPAEERGKSYKLVIQFVPTSPANESVRNATSVSRDVTHGKPEIRTQGQNGTQVLELQNSGANLQ
jgi:hypothetical protein